MYFDGGPPTGSFQGQKKKKSLVTQTHGEGYHSILFTKAVCVINYIGSAFNQI